MTGFAILMVAAAIAFGLSKLLRLPPIPLLMLAGVGIHLVADSVGFDTSENLLKQMIEIGLAALVFTAGVDLSPRRIKGRTGPMIAVAVLQFSVLGIVGVGTALLLGYTMIDALYLGFALSASSTLVAVRHLQKRRQLFEPFGRLVLGVLLLQDIFIILLMVALLKSPLGWVAILWGISKAIGLGFLAYTVHRWLVPWIATRGKLDDEELMIGSLGVLFIFSAMAYLLNLPFLVGAFLAGFALSAFPMNGLVRGMLGSLSGFFLALFFLSIGAVLALPSLTTIIHSLIFILVLIVVTVSLVTIVAEIVGFSTRASIEAGLLLSQTSEFSLLLALAGVGSGQISRELFSMIALITVSTMTFTPFLSKESVAWKLMKLHPRYRRGEVVPEDIENHAVLLGYGRGGPQTIRALKERGLRVIVVDDDAAVIGKLIAQKITCIQGDGSDEKTLRHANCKEARVVFCSMRRTRDAETALDYLQGARAKVIVRTFEPNEKKVVEELGGYAVETAKASTNTFLAWMQDNISSKKLSNAEA